MPNSRTKSDKTKDTDDLDWETVFHRDQATGKSPSPGKGKAKLDGKDKPEGKTDIKTRSNCLIGKRPWSSVSPPKAKMDPKGKADSEPSHSNKTQTQSHTTTKTLDHSSDLDYHIPKKIHKQATVASPSNQPTPCFDWADEEPK